MSTITQPASYITFRLGAELFAIDVVQVREVLDLTQITRVPTAPDYMRGVVNVRGSTVPVIDMRRKFGLAPGPDTVNTRIVVLELGLDGERAIVGGLADSVHDVIELEPAQITDPPRIAMRWRTDVIRGMGKQGEQFIIILDIDKVFAADGGLLVETAQAGQAAVEASA